MPETRFVGYDRAETEAKVLAIVADGEFREEIPAGTEAIVVLDRTPLYAEMGGQVADHGTLTAGGLHFEVSDVQKNKGGKFMHYGKLLSGDLKLGDTVTASYDEPPRGHRPRPQRHPSAAEGPARRAGRACAPGRLSGGARLPAL